MISKRVSRQSLVTSPHLTAPHVLRLLVRRLQADAGAQVVQIFDSWASHLSPQDFDVFSGPYIKKVCAVPGDVS
jgi:hypothetical protein